MYYPTNTEIIALKIKRCECLYWTILVNKQSTRRQIVLPCCSAMLEPNVVPLRAEFRSCEDGAWWVSILNSNGESAVNKEKNCRTLLFCNAWARCCAPSWLIRFMWRSSVMSVYIERYWWISSRQEDKLSYCVILQCVSKMLCSFVTNFVPVKIERGKCLNWIAMLNLQWINR